MNMDAAETVIGSGRDSVEKPMSPRISALSPKSRKITKLNYDDQRTAMSVDLAYIN